MYLQCKSLIICSGHLETLYHLFIECKFVKRIWNWLNEQLTRLLHVNVKLEPHQIIFNQYEGLHQLTVNCIILIIKQYIYASKWLQKKPNIQNAIIKIITCKNEKITETVYTVSFRCQDAINVMSCLITTHSYVINMTSCLLH